MLSEAEKPSPPAAEPAVVDLTDAPAGDGAASATTAAEAANAVTTATAAAPPVAIDHNDLSTPPSGWPGVFKTPRLQNYVAICRCTS